MKVVDNEFLHFVSLYTLSDSLLIFWLKILKYYIFTYRSVQWAAVIT